MLWGNQEGKIQRHSQYWPQDTARKKTNKTIQHKLLKEKQPGPHKKIK